VKSSPRAFAALLAAAFLAAHLPFLPPSLEDVDSINFALGLRDFDVAEHQPHPPGYPVFILLAKGVLSLVGSEAAAMSLLSVVSGALSAYLVMVLTAGLLHDGSRTPGVLAALIAVTSPLFWVTAARPLSDATGLLAALVTQAAIVTSASGPGLRLASALAGLGTGIRSQVAWLTLPLLALALLRAPTATRTRALLAFAVGVAAWFVPLVIATGGPAAYWQTLSAQGAEDFAGVAMLWTTPTVRQLTWSLRDTFLTPWSRWTLAAAVLMLAAVGAGRLLLTNRGALLTTAVAFGPYLVLHLLFQETITTRYALPVIVPVAILAVCGADLAGRRVAVGLSALLAAVSLTIGLPALAAYSSSEAPAFRMLADMEEADRSAGSGDEPAVAMHRREAFDLRRPVRWAGEHTLAGMAHLASPPKHEWLEVVAYWNGGGRKPIWFVADPLRSDLALIHHDEPKGRYRWPLAEVGLIGGVRPGIMDWYILDRPAWYLGEGWAVTPETAGVAEEDGKGPGRGGIEGRVRRTAGRATLMIGGRNLSAEGPPARVTVALDGQPVEMLDAPPGFFLRLLTLEAGRLVGESDYARLTVSADQPRVAIEQFDAQPAGRPVYGFGDGWHEQEYNPTTGALWRWTTERSVVRVRSEGRDLILTVRGETNPSADRPRFILRAGTRVVVDEPVEQDFSIHVRIPADLLAGPDPTLVLETDQTYVAAEEEWRSSDRRRLGIRIYEWRLTPAS
jgi:hypothetical protein